MRSVTVENGILGLGLWLLIAACSTAPLTGRAPNEVVIETEITDEEPQDGLTQQPVTQSMTVWAVHDPIYSEKAHTAVITARAESPDSDIGEISIEVVAGEISDCTDLDNTAPPSVIPCRINAQSDSKKCKFPSDTGAGECTFSIDVNTDSIISYRATATSLTNVVVSSPSITFAGGQPKPSQVRPIWWHTDLPQGASTMARMNLGFFPDEDYTGVVDGMEDFSTDINAIVAGAFFEETDTFAREFTANRHYFDLWVGPLGADATSSCDDFKFDAQAAPARAAIDAGAIVHWIEFGDCADISFPGDGSVYGYSYYNSWLLVHEAGHFLFGMGDEHDFGGHFACSSPGNVFKDKDVCDTVLQGINALPEAKCIAIDDTGKYRIDEDLQETMRTKSKSSGFHSSSGNAVTNQFEVCLTGNCYGGGNSECFD